MQFKQGHLVKILGCSAATEAKWLDPINAACAKYQINTKLRLAAFIAQVGHESGRLSAVTENLNYSAAGLQATWPARFDAAKAAACARNPEKIANVVYSSRMGNGPEASGDGWKYRGRGLIQCTGKSNYQAFSQSAGTDAVGNPDALAQPAMAAMSAGWFWDSKGLNSYADRSDLLTITKRINGGTNGQDDRAMLYKKALAVLSDEPTPTDEEAAKKADPAPDTTAPVSEEKTPAAQNASIVEPKGASGDTAKYPWNAVFESRSGHFTEVDDTPGSERLNMTHRTGSYWEIGPTGTFTWKSVLDSYKLTKGDSYDYTGGNYTQQVSGQSYRQSSGDMIFKTGGNYFVNASKVQMNTGMLSVSGEINSPSINSPVFGGMSGGASFGNMVARESLVAYDLRDGGAPMMGGAIGFTGGNDTSGGSADSHLSNNLSKQAPNGTPWVTNGVPAGTTSSSPSGSDGSGSGSGSSGSGSSSSGSSSSATVGGSGNDYDVPPEAGSTFKVSDLVKVGVGAAAAAGAVMGIIKAFDPDPAVANTMASAVGDLNNSTAQTNNQTPVFLKHVSFDKPTLLSQSIATDAPDPSLYVNNYHTIVDSTGAGNLAISDGTKWVKLTDISKQYADDQLSHLNDDFTARLVDESVARAQAISQEAAARQAAITQGLLDEATARGAAVTAEATARQSADDSLSDRILTLTASVNDNAAAIQQEQTARADAITAEASARETLATTVAGNTAAILSEATSRSNADSALSTRIDQVSATTDANTAAITSESSARTSADSALSTRIDAVVATAGANTAAITSEQTARANADTALSGRIDSVVATAASNTAGIVTEQSARVAGDQANADLITTVQSTMNSAGAALNRLSNSTFLNLTSGLPTGWAVYNNTPAETTTLSMQPGPDGYQAVRVTWTGTNSSTKGLIQSPIATPMKANSWYIIAFKVRAVTNTVGAKVSANYSNAPMFSDYVVLQDPVLSTTNWQWYVAKVRRTAGDSSELFISIVGAIANGAYEISQPTIQEGQIFLGYNEGPITASVIAEASTRANQYGQVTAQWGVKTNVNGYVTGIALVSDLINGNPTSSFTVSADVFKLVKPGTTTIATPFSVDSSGNAVFAGMLTVKSAASGQRTEITNSAVQVYDSAGTLRVRLGVW